MSQVVTFGEIMMRLSAQSHLRLIQASQFDVTYAGAEANVAVSLANFGIDVAFVTKLPKNDLGLAVLRILRQYGVDTSYICFGEGRLGLYFLETGFPRDLRRLYMTEPTLFLHSQIPMILTGIKF